MPTPNDLANQLLIGRAYNFTPQQQKNLMGAQQQQALAQALMQEGLSPINQQNRQVGGVAGIISPWEGVNKLAQVGLGSYEQKNANEALANALMPSPDASGQQLPVGGNALNNLPLDIQNKIAQWSLPESLGGNPRAAEGLISTFAGLTPEQKNLGINPYQQAPQQQTPQIPPMQGDPGGGLPAPQAPVQGPQPLPSPQGMMPPQNDALSQYRQQQDMLAPPIDAQRAGMGLPVGASTNAPLPPSAMPVVQNALNPAPQAAPAASMPTPQPGESAAQFRARLEVAEDIAKAQGQVAPAGAKTQAEDTGKNLADAQKTFNVAAGNFPRAMQRFDQLRQAAATASYGKGVSDQEPEQGFLENFVPSPDYARNFARTTIGEKLEPGKAIANQTIEQAASQGIMAELAPQLAGLKGNKFLESLASSASGLNPADPPDAKQNAINGLQDQYIGNMRSLAQQRRSYGDPAAPSDMDLAMMISKNSPAAQISVIAPNGNAGKVSAAHLPDLIKSGGQFK